MGGAALFLAFAVASGAKQPAPGLIAVRPGMTAREVHQLLGPPARVSRQILYRRYLEQWLYEGSSPFRIEFSALHRQEPQVLNVYPSG